MAVAAVHDARCFKPAFSKTELSLGGVRGFNTGDHAPPGAGDPTGGHARSGPTLGPNGPSSIAKPDPNHASRPHPSSWAIGISMPALHPPGSQSQVDSGSSAASARLWIGADAGLGPSRSHDRRLAVTPPLRSPDRNRRPNASIAMIDQRFHAIQADRHVGSAPPPESASFGSSKSDQQAAPTHGGHDH
jgi:hypothetical protein